MYPSWVLPLTCSFVCEKRLVKNVSKQHSFTPRFSSGPVKVCAPGGVGQGDDCPLNFRWQREQQYLPPCGCVGHTLPPSPATHTHIPDTVARSGEGVGLYTKFSQQHLAYAPFLYAPVTTRSPCHPHTPAKAWSGLREAPHPAVARA